METQTISRRSIAKGAAWSVPAVAVAGAAPAMAASTPVTVSGTVCKIFSGTGTQTTQNEQVFLGVNSSTSTIPKGTKITWTFTVDLSTIYSDGPGGAAQAPNLTYTPSGNWTLTSDKAAGASVASGTGTGTFIVTWTAVNDVPAADVACIMSANWPGTSGSGDPTLTPGSTLTVSSSVTGPGSVTPSGGSLSWQTPRRSSTATRSNHPRYYRSKSGAQACYPVTQYGYQAGNVAAQGSTGSSCGDGKNNTSTVYPDGTCAFVQVSNGTQVAVPEKCA